MKVTLGPDGDATGGLPPAPQFVAHMSARRKVIKLDIARPGMGSRGEGPMQAAQARAVMISYLEGALEFAEEIKDGVTAYLIERALDEARSQAFSSMPLPMEVN